VQKSLSERTKFNCSQVSSSLASVFGYEVRQVPFLKQQLAQHTFQNMKNMDEQMKEKFIDYM